MLGNRGGGTPDRLVEIAEGREDTDMPCVGLKLPGNGFAFVRIESQFISGDQIIGQYAGFIVVQTEKVTVLEIAL